MKITKLFHWLYASLMFLPLLYVLFRCLYVIINKNATADIPLTDMFSVSVQNLNTEVLFSWATQSFLNTPILYITNLFNIPSTSPIITLLSYWLSISIIWLVFDFVMYVPLLCHRWLDKGGIK